MKFRQHRGGYAESMETVIEVDSLKALMDHLESSFIFNYRIAELKFEYVGIDHRNNWKTYYVSQRIKGKKNFEIVGMSDGTFTEGS